MRAELQAVTAAPEENPYQHRREVSPTLPWHQYIAFHDKWELFVGTHWHRALLLVLHA